MVNYGFESAIRRLQRLSKRHSRRNLNDWLDSSIARENLDNACFVLNIGSGGEIEEGLWRNGLRPISIDTDPARNPDIVMNAEDMGPFDDSRFDAVILMEVMEHLPNPPLAIAEIFRVLKPGGVLLGSSPFALGIHDRPHDYYRFTRYGLEHLFREFECIRLKERNSYFSAVYVLCLRVLNVGSRKQVRRAVWLSPLLLALHPLFWLLNRVFPRDDLTTGYFFVFRKRVSPEGVS